MVNEVYIIAFGQQQQLSMFMARKASLTHDTQGRHGN